MNTCIYLSVKQAATRYGVSESCIWKWVQKGVFVDPVKIGGTTRWNICVLEEFEASLGS